MSENFLSRWSKRKLEVRAREKQAEDAPELQLSAPFQGSDTNQVTRSVNSLIHSQRRKLLLSLNFHCPLKLIFRP
jgi:hypothetical protein